MGDDLEPVDTSKDERLIGLKTEVHEQVLSKVVELLNKEDDGLTLLERQVTNFMSNEQFTEKIRDIIVAKISYLITDLGTEVIYKTLVENEELVPLLKDVLQSMNAIKTLEEMSNNEDKKNTQKINLIAELIAELKEKATAAATEYIKTSTNEDKKEEEEEEEEETEEEKKDEDEEETGEEKDKE